MRNCFVPKCDAECKNVPKRMMFCPPKDERTFEMWRQILPKKRALKKIDRICERHFYKDDILTTWDHIIKGVLHQISRGKPKLREHSMPVLNLPIDHQRKSTEKTKKKKNESVKDESMDLATIEVENVSEQYLEPSEFDDFVYKIIQPNSEPMESEHSEADPVEENDNRTHLEENVEVEDGKEAANLFESIYDDVFEVELPNTLWGIHRDPERKYLVFSFFDAKTMTTTKLLSIDDRLESKIYLYNNIIEQNHVKNVISIDWMSNLITEIDAYRICLAYDKYNNSENVCHILVADDDSDYCHECINKF